MKPERHGLKDPSNVEQKGHPGVNKITCTYLNPKIALIGPDCVREISRYMKVLGRTKAVGIVAYNGGIINDYEIVGKVKKGIPPLIHPMWQ